MGCIRFGYLNKPVLFEQCSRFEALIVCRKVGYGESSDPRIPRVLDLREKDRETLNQLREIGLAVVFWRYGKVRSG